VSYYLWWVEGVDEGHLQVEEEVASLVRAAHRATYRGLRKSGRVQHPKFHFYIMYQYVPNYPAYSICEYIPQLLDIL
jgi:hypothetical protein